MYIMPFVVYSCMANGIYRILLLSVIDTTVCGNIRQSESYQYTQIRVCYLIGMVEVKTI